MEVAGSGASQVAGGEGGSSHVLPSALTSAPPVLGTNGQVIDTSKFLVGRVLVPPGILSNNGGSVIGQNGANIVSNKGGSVIGQNGANVIGQNGANVIGQNSANVIGGNTAAVIGQNGANIVSNNGGSVIGQNGANIVSNNGGSFTLGQLPLAYAKLRVVDASGKTKTGKNGQPLEGFADASGQFLIPRADIDANSVIKVESKAIKGELSALLTKGTPISNDELEVDIVSTMSTNYILDRFVDNDQKILDKLTNDLELEARSDVRAALIINNDAIKDTNEVSRSLEAFTRILNTNKDVTDVYLRIEKLLILAGVTKDGDGLIASDTPFGPVGGMKATSFGLFTFMPTEHRLVLIDNDGLIRTQVPQNGWPYPEDRNISFPKHTGMDYYRGWIYLCDNCNNRIVRVKDGRVELLAGNGKNAKSADGMLATDSALEGPSGLAIAVDGTVYFSESSVVSRIRKINSQGRLETAIGGSNRSTADNVTNPLDISIFSVTGMAFDSAGNLLIVDDGIGDEDRVLKYNTNTRSLQVVNVTVNQPGPISVSDGRVFLTSNGPGGFQTLMEIASDRLIDRSPIQNLDDSKQKSWLFSPISLSIRGGNAFIQQSDEQIISFNIDNPGPIKVIGGKRFDFTPATLRSATSFDVNPKGDIIIADSNRVFLQESGRKLRLLAGNGETGWEREATDATKSPLCQVYGIKWDGEDSAVCISKSLRGAVDSKTFPTIQRIYRNGSRKTIVGNGENANGTPNLGIATEVSLNEPVGIKVLPDHRISFVDTGYNYILNSDGTLEYSPKPPITEQITYIIDYYKDSINKHDDREVVSVAKLSEIAGQFTSTSQNPSLIEIMKVRLARPGKPDIAYIATDNEVGELNIGTGKFRLIAGKGGLIFNLESNDTSLREVKDIILAPSGDLLILEPTQVKRVPSALL